MKLPVSDYQVVKKGQLIAEIDPRIYTANVVIARANLDAARAALENMGNQIDLQQAAIAAAVSQNKSAIAAQANTAAEFTRQTNLGDFTTRQSQEKARTENLEAEATLSATVSMINEQKAQLKVLKGQEAVLEAHLESARGNLESARVNESYTRIYAPFDGTLGKKMAHEGDYVTVGTPIISQVPLPAIYVTANFKETQISQMQPGDPVEISIDAFPDRVLSGFIAALAPASGSMFALLPPDNATGNFTKVVQRIPVRVEFKAGQGLMDLLKPGMSAAVRVSTLGARPQ